MSLYQITNVYPLTIPNDGIVNVSFSSIAPAEDDWIGAYSPAVNMEDVFDTVPVKFGYCTWGLHSTYLTTGSGQLSFNLTNLRENVSFYYFTGGFYWPAIFNTTVLVNAYNDSVAFQNVDEPLKNRIVPTGNPNIFKLLWSAAYNINPTVKWGTSSGEYSQSATATVSNISRSSLCGAPAQTIGWRELGNIYTAELDGMASLSNSLIYYIFGDAASDFWSNEFAFLIPPFEGTNPSGRGTRVAMLADAGVGSGGISRETLTWQDTGEAAYNTTLSVSNLIRQNLVDAIVIAGDLSYADGYLANWDFFMDMISPIAGSRLVLSQVGNHESDTPGTASNFGYGADSGGECSKVSLAMFPQPYPATANAPWYSYNIGLIHFVAMSTEHNFTIGSPQYLFLQNDLQSVNRGITPWIVFVGHRSLYVDSNETGYPGSDTSVMASLQANIEPLLHTYGVQLAVAGHFHNVERQAAVYQGKVVQSPTIITDASGNEVAVHTNANATVYMVIGTAGQTPVLPTKMYAWSEKVINYSNGYAVVEAVNSTHLFWEYIDSSYNIVLDRVLLIQPSPPLSPDDDDRRHHGSSTSTGDIIGIVIVSVVVVIGMAIMCVLAPEEIKKNETNYGFYSKENKDAITPYGGEVEVVVKASSVDSTAVVSSVESPMTRSQSI